MVWARLYVAAFEEGVLGVAGYQEAESTRLVAHRKQSDPPVWPIAIKMADAILMAMGFDATLSEREGEDCRMVTPQLSVRSSKARDLAHKLARRENRTIADIVERALESYEAREAGHELAADFYRRLSSQSGTDIDLDSVIDENRRPHKGVEL